MSKKTGSSAVLSAARQHGKTVRVALVIRGEITDQGWGTVGYHGLTAARDQLGVEIAYRESVQLPDYESVLCDYARQGYDLVIGHGSDFGEAATRAAQKYPHTFFAVTNCDVKGPNLAGLDTKNEEMGYIAGVVSGLLSKSGVAAFVGATRILAMARAEQGFIEGVKAVAPDCKALIAYIGSVDNEEMGRKTGLELIAQKADVLFNNDDAAGWGLMRVAEEQGVLAIGSDYDQKAIAPGAVVTSVLVGMTPVILSIVKEVVDGAFKPDTVRLYGFDTGTYDLSPLDMSMVTQAQAEKIYAVRDRLVSGELKLPHSSVFSGIEG